jgi:hypothetical protein
MMVVDAPKTLIEGVDSMVNLSNSISMNVPPQTSLRRLMFQYYTRLIVGLRILSRGNCGETEDRDITRRRNGYD